MGQSQKQWIPAELFGVAGVDVQQCAVFGHLLVVTGSPPGVAGGP